MARNNGVAGRWPRRGIAFLILGEPALLRPVKHRRITELPRLLLSLWLTHRLRSTRASIHLLLPSIASIPFWSFLRSLWESTNLSSSSNPWQKIKRCTTHGNVWYEFFVKITFNHSRVVIDRLSFAKIQKKKREFKNSNNTCRCDKIEVCSFFDRCPIGESKGSRAERKKKKGTRIRDFYLQPRKGCGVVEEGGGRRGPRWGQDAFQSAVTRGCQRGASNRAFGESGAGTRLCLISASFAVINVA